MNKIKPILPCPSIKDQVSFYESMGFENTYSTNRPNPYAVVKYDSVELHFYGTKRIPPAENPQMCYLEVDDVDLVYERFTAGLKNRLGRVPRAGIPRISKLKELSEDRRFILTDVGGNTIFVGTPHAMRSGPVFFRTLESSEHAANFETLYDLLYSKEDIPAAFKMRDKFFPADPSPANLGDLDAAKFGLVALDLHIQRDGIVDPAISNKLQALLRANDRTNPDWEKIARRYSDLVREE